MARIGDSVQAGLNQYDPTPWLNASASASRSIGNSVSGLLDRFVADVDQKKKAKDDIRSGKEIGKALATLDPGLEAAIQPFLDRLDDGEIPESARAQMAQATPALVEAWLNKQSSDRGFSLQARGADLDERGMGIREAAAEREGRVFESNFADGQKWKAAEDETRAQIAPFLVEQAIGVAREMEASGARPPMSPDALQQVLQTGTPEQKIQASETFMGLLPKRAKPEFREIPVTIDGQPSTATAAFNYDTGEFEIVPVSEPRNLDAFLPGSSEPFAVRTTHYSTGKDAGGPDELQDKWTNRGYSSTGKNLTPGIVAVNDKVFPLGTVFEDTNTGEVFIAGDRHGNKDPNVVDIYQPPNAYTKETGRRNLRIIGREKRVGKNPQEVQAQLDRYRAALSQPRVMPGAAKSSASPKTPTEQALDEARLRSINAQVQNREADLAKQDDAKATARASAEGALQLIKDLRTHPGFSSAVGVSLVPKFIPATDRKGAEAIIDQLKGQSFLTAIQQLRGLGALSDAEGQKLQQAAARLNTNQSEEDFRKALDDFEGQVKEALSRLGGMSASPEPSAADKLRARIQNAR